MNEKQFIETLKQGDRAAYEALFLEFKDKILNTCLGFVPNQHDAEDICQEVFVKVFKTVKDFKGDAKLSTWIYRIAVTESLQHIRNRKRKKRMAFFQALVGLDNEAVNVADNSYQHPGIQLENKERARVLFQHIESLPDNQRAVFTLHKVEGLAYKEIADILDMSLSSVESLMFRARKNLKKKLTTYYTKQMI